MTQGQEQDIKALKVARVHIQAALAAISERLEAWPPNSLQRDRLELQWKTIETVDWGLGLNIKRREKEAT